MKKKQTQKEYEIDAFFKQMEEDFQEMDKLSAKFQAVVEHHLLPQTYKAKRVSNEQSNDK